MRAPLERSETKARSRFRPLTTRYALLAVFGLILAACSGSGPQSALEPRGPIAEDLDGLWILVFSIAVGVFVLVNAALVIALVRFRERKDDDRRPKQVHGNTKLEITWTIIPAVILAVITVPTVQGIFDVRAVPDDPETMHVKVTGHQWWWEYEYVGYERADGRPLYSANELHIPAGIPVYLTMTSADVIHSYWIPPLNGKRDVVPGRISNLTLEADLDVPTTDYGAGVGVLLGQCAEFCGLAHADMRARVIVHTRDDFDAWINEQLQPAPIAESGTAADGFRTFNAVCTACHQVTVQQPDGTVEWVGPADFFLESDGIQIHSTLGPDLTSFNSRYTFGGAVFDNTADHLAVWLNNPADLKPMEPERNDIANRLILGMPNFGLTQQEIFELVEMLETWGAEPPAR